MTVDPDRPHGGAGAVSAADALRPVAVALQASRIREVANAGLGRADVLAFWFGESDEPTPVAVRAAAEASLQRGETFYSHNLGLPELRAAIAADVSRRRPAVDVSRIAVTSSGVSALMVAAQMLVGAGDEVVAVVPVWPNLTAQPAILGARVVRVPLRPDPAGAWRLDLDALCEAVTSRTRMLLVNAPNNPTGWTLTSAEQRALLEHCRRTGTWIVADEVYERLWYGADDPGSPVIGEPPRGVASGARLGAPDDDPGSPVIGEPPRGVASAASLGAASPLSAPSFLDHARPDDRLIVVHSFSKSYLMTGWRLGWLVLPEGCADTAGKLLEYNSSCAPVFVQRGALAALALGDPFVADLAARCRAGRDRLVGGLRTLPGVTVATPDAGLYAFFRIVGEDDSVALAKRLVREQGLGLAPGAAFGAEGEGWLRWCFATQDPARLDAGLERLRAALHL